MDINYEMTTKNIVKSQAELDAIPVDFTGQIYIDSGTYYFNRVIVKHRYLRSVEALGNSSVEARGNSSVVAWDNSSVLAWDNSSVVAWDNSSVVAWDNSSVEARGNSSVEARGNSSVEAWDNSSVVARGNSQIVKRSDNSKIKISGNARIVYMPKTITKYCDFYGVEHNKRSGKFFKCVHKINGRYYSDHSTSYEYLIGEKAVPDSFDKDPDKDCGHGIHVAYLDWALKYGENWKDVAILEVEARFKDIVVPNSGAGKVRCKEVKVLREVPLEECGLYGKILAKKRTTHGN